MNIKYLSYLVCPVCKGDFFTEFKEKKTVILNDKLICKSCKKSYPVNDGVPVLMNDIGAMKSTQESFSNEWALRNSGFFEKNLSSGYSKEDRYKKILNILEIDQNILKNKLFLDAGCGDGVYGAHIAINNPQTLVFLADISAGVKHTKEKLKNIDNCIVIQCDLMRAPFKEGIFDYIWSDGVLHHTPNTRKAFNSVDQLVKVGGKFYVWLYPNYKKSYYLLVRDLMIKPYILPVWILYLCSLILSFPYWILCKIFNMYKLLFTPNVKQLLKKRTFMSVAFSIYDSISPTYQFRHGKEEVKNWFDKNGYEDVKIVGDLGIVGIKKKSDIINNEKK
tara:strand:- start:166 stop:1167 length:1002 start_codon:yes stop_codon:yes gene_type:complete